MSEFKFQIDLSEIERDLPRELEEISKRALQIIADKAPEEMQELMATSTPEGNSAKGGGKHSAVGQPPAIVTRTLFRSLQGKVTTSTTTEIEMVDYGFYLDPFFASEGGGHLNRPFAELGINRAIVNNLSDL